MICHPIQKIPDSNNTRFKPQIFRLNNISRDSIAHLHMRKSIHTLFKTNVRNWFSYFTPKTQIYFLTVRCSESSTTPTWKSEFKFKTRKMKDKTIGFLFFSEFLCRPKTQCCFGESSSKNQCKYCVIQYRQPQYLEFRTAIHIYQNKTKYLFDLQ